jgi:hypothetical protein
MARLLLDEQLPVRLKQLLGNHTVATVRDRQWRGLTNGSLLRQAQHEFDVFVTMDKAIPFQQSLEGLSIGVLLLRAQSNSLRRLRPHADRIASAANGVPHGAVVELDLR